MPQWQPCVWVPGHYASSHDYADFLQPNSIDDSSIEAIAANSSGFLYSELYHPCPRSIFSSGLVHPSTATFNPDSPDRAIDSEAAPWYTNVMDDLAGESPAERLPTERRNIAPYHSYASHIPRTNNSVENNVPTAAFDMTFSLPSPSSSMGDAPAPDHPHASTECLEIVPNVASKSETMTMATFSIATAENLIRVDSLNENTREEPSACSMNTTICPESCPPGYQKRCFPPQMAARIIRVYGIPAYNVYYYRWDGDRDDHLCPLNCGQHFVGGSIKAHLEKFHPNINSHSRKEVCCRTQSHSKSKCPPKNIVQGRYFVKHFTVMHSLAHSLCPFCLVRQTRVDHLYRHFAACRVLNLPKDRSKLK
ncbi:hypothetical protein ARMGADRAFT_1171260 [Armillaria gallica]|uniref:Uncharacterized protein n=1 Tax=Armillaria gallica TaxID=47427 RepID=A0A2H3CJ16_ARMGA|nr:hypothetical protein ARMGADRAFT_1171260 [Armillaria gallica]